MRAEIPQPRGAAWAFHLCFDAQPLAIRGALARVVSALPEVISTSALRIALEIVLAEVLNNIVEHAYACSKGEIELTLWTEGEEVQVVITDQGTSMPAGEAPKGKAALPHHPDNLPEGGFGWMLIRALARDLRYNREAGSNRLAFRLTPPLSSQSNATAAG